ncbi:12147_t:CDS:2 [Entrophospora sp. SA101]|nr:12147_t:CDS:2 [Entrophospora sp. SA101]
MKKFAVKEWAELISDPIMLRGQDQRIFNHADLPVVKDQLSMTLRLRLMEHSLSYDTIFHKGTEDLIRTPGLWLGGDKLHARFTGNWDCNAGIDELTPGLFLNKWYHLTYTLSDSEKKIRFLHRRPIVKGSKVALVHVPTRKYLSTKGVIAFLEQYMVIGNGQEIDLKNDVWTVIGACGTSESAGSPVYFNTIVGFKHRATGGNLHSHGMDCGTTPKSNHQQALYSHDILLDDGTQEVSCYGNGNDENNKWRIELID